MEPDGEAGEEGKGGKVSKNRREAPIEIRAAGWLKMTTRRW